MTAISTKVDFGELDDENEHKYLLGRNYLAACRLNLQTYFWKESFQFNLHPSIPVTQKSIIADVAAGTGSWLIDVARELPEATLDGFDIDLSQAPHPKWLPKNTTMRHWNIFEDLPPDVIEKYDIVHVRLLVLAMEKKDLQSMIERFRAMLKPGGYLQWDDLDNVHMHVRKIEQELSTPALDQLKEMCYSGGRHDWTLDIPKVMAKNGFSNTAVDQFIDRIELARAVNEQHLMTMEEFAATLTKAGKREAAMEFHKVIGGAYQESLQGAALCIPRIACIGSKAS